MADEDRAQDREIREWELNNAPRPDPVRYQPGDAGYGPAECEDCDDEMPAERRANGWTLCTACKSVREVRDRQFRR